MNRHIAITRKINLYDSMVFVWLDLLCVPMRFSFHEYQFDVDFLLVNTRSRYVEMLGQESHLYSKAILRR